MNILAMDTAQGACSAALWSADRICAHRFELMSMGHAERLVLQVMEVMEEAGAEMAGLDRLACTIGPGTFTGTRIALSTGRGMALALNIPIVPVTTLEAVAAALPQTDAQIRAAAFDAKRGELYLQLFEGDRLAPLTEPSLLSYEAAAEATVKAANGLPVAIAGTGAGLLAYALEATGIAAEIPDLKAHPDARLVAEIAATRQPAGTPPSPLYLREPDAKLPGSK